MGLSPRGRGKLLRLRNGNTSSGSIPAWAGETETLSRCRPTPAVYPRVGGGNSERSTHCRDIAGLSPRGRGKLVFGVFLDACYRSIPAWAGETATLIFTSRRKAVYPRVGGGNNARSDKAALGIGLSPRGRGKRYRGLAGKRAAGSIPAWAGETLPKPIRLGSA